MVVVGISGYHNDCDYFWVVFAISQFTKLSGSYYSNPAD